MSCPELPAVGYSRSRMVVQQQQKKTAPIKGINETDSQPPTESSCSVGEKAEIITKPFMEDVSTQGRFFNLMHLATTQLTLQSVFDLDR